MKNNPDGESIEVFAICYNEELMLPYFIEHYKSMGAKISIFDNNSTDRSKEIILAAGLTYYLFNSNDQIRDDLYLNIKNSCWKNSTADWVIVCDIDEFLEIPFSTKPYTIINTKGYDMLGLPGSRNGIYNRKYSKHIMFRPNMIKEINYKPGCHTCSPQGKVVPSSEQAHLLHYKYTSEETVFERHKIYEQRLSDKNKEFGWGIEYENVQREKITEKFRELKEKAIVVPENPEVISF